MEWVMKKMKLVGFLVLTALAASVARAEYGDLVRQGLQAAAADVEASLREAGLSEENISLLPIGNDQGRYVQGLLKNAVTGAGLPYVEHGNDPMWNAILAEVAWDERKGDMLDPATLVKFGQLKGAELLMYGSVREVFQSPGKVFVELELHLTSVTTKQHVWGGIFAKRFYQPGDVVGVVALDPAVRQVLKTAFEGAAESIRKSPKLGGVATVAMVPLSGDLDGYVTTLTQNMLSETQLNPKDLDVATLSEARSTLRDQPGVADAVLFGAVRDLARELKHDEAMKNVYEVRAEIQLTLQSAESGDVLWSRTLSAEALDEDVITGKEAAWTVLKNNPRLPLIVGGVIVGLLVLGMFFKAVSRPR
jgi:hypothetical protein